MPRLRVAHVIVPAAGRGTRLQPASLAVAKELMPVGALPVIQRVVEGAAAAGMQELVAVYSPQKPGVRAYLEEARHESLDRLRHRITLRFVEQVAPKGVADALVIGWRALGEPEIVAILMPDMVRIEGTPPLAELLSVYRDATEEGARLPWPPLSLGAVQHFSRARGDGARTSYALDRWSGRVYRVQGLRQDLRGSIGAGTTVVGRAFFEAALHCRRPQGEFSDVEVYRMLLQQGALLLAVRLQGPPVYDVGTPMGLARAQYAFSRLRHERTAGHRNGI